MGKLTVFNQVSLDGFFSDKNRDMSWAHNNKPDQEWDSFVAQNLKGGGRLIYGRVTYEMMASFWPTPDALQFNPVMAKQMNDYEKIVFSRTLKKATWSNSRVVSTDPVAEIARLKKESSDEMTILGSGTIATQLLEAGLVDDLILIVLPIVLGQGKTIFATAKGHVHLELTSSRAFKNGNLLLNYGRAQG